MRADPPASTVNAIDMWRSNNGWRFLCPLLGLTLLAASLQSRGQGNESLSNRPIPIAEVSRHLQLPAGFRAALFAGEPDVQQPIAMTFDDRGRLWVAECLTYSDAKTNFDLSLHDRILIFEDSKGTGHFDKRTVFWDRGQRLTSIAVGFGGVFATCAPHLLFIPDRNGDDVPDGPPEVLLDGWNADVVRHNIVNGLKWGPDGWLYGRHGIMATSDVGKPGSPESARTKLNCAIWRYHPTRKIFEIVCQGGTNPWGHDWDQNGELFFINTVIGHLWEGIPGACFKRMYGEHLAPYRYGLIDQAADHYHWDTGKNWTDSRNAGAGADALGGGHAHAGLMIYLAHNWPTQYFGKLFTLNFHGRRINEERLERAGSGVVGKHDPDLIKFEDPWFRGIDLDYGPDGGVYVLDWSDTGECHENDADGVHRETGRVFKINYPAAPDVAPPDSDTPVPADLLAHGLAGLPTPELVRLQLHPNEWYARHARRLLQERAAAGASMADTTAELLRLFEAQTAAPRKIRLLFALHAVGGDSQSWLMKQLGNPDDYIRSWAVRFLVENGVKWETLLPEFLKLATQDRSATVRLYLASTLQRVPVPMRAPLADALLQHGEDVGDHYIPLMLWYAVEPIAAQFPNSAIVLAQQSQIPLVREYIARRLGETFTSHPAPVDALLRTAAAEPLPALTDMLRGLAESLSSLRNASQPAAWETLRRAALRTGDAAVKKLVQALGVIFGDPWAFDQLRQTAFDTQAAAEDRRTALRQLISARPADLKSVLEKALTDPATVGVAGRGLLMFAEPEIGEEVLRHWSLMQPDDQAAVVGALASRPATAELLLDAVAGRQIPRSSLTAFQARQIRSYDNDALTKKLTAVWGEVRTSSADKTELMARYRALLTPERLKQADLSRGREVFNQVCSVCHKLYGQGASIGPDLTGGGRASLDYLLENIVDPSAIVPADYKVSDVELKDDRDFTALIVARTERTLTLQTPTERLTVDRNDIARIRETQFSLMPEGLLQGLNNEQICNLIAYLMSPVQVPLPSR